jgi:hypothetical protein
MHHPLFSFPASLRIIRLAVVLCILFTVSASADTLQAGIDTFFVQLSGTFDHIASNPATKKKRLSVVDRYFLSQLKRHQVIRSITKSDAKGVCRTELVRMKKPNHKKQNFKKEQWFTNIARGEQEYQTIVRDTGRYYLVWSKPITTSATVTPRIIGVIMMKIDLWDCFQEISQTTDKPFLVYLKKLRFYDHKWKKSYPYTEHSLTVPGAGAMTLRVQKEMAPDTSQAVAQLETAKIDSTPVAAAKKKPVNAKIGILIGVAGAAVLVVLIAFLISWIKNKLVIRAINKGM